MTLRVAPHKAVAAFHTTCCGQYKGIASDCLVRASKVALQPGSTATAPVAVVTATASGDSSRSSRGSDQNRCVSICRVLIGQGRALVSSVSTDRDAGTIESPAVPQNQARERERKEHTVTPRHLTVLAVQASAVDSAADPRATSASAQTPCSSSPAFLLQS